MGDFGYLLSVFMSHLLRANQRCLVADSTSNQLEEQGPIRVFGLTSRYSLSVNKVGCPVPVNE